MKNVKELSVTEISKVNGGKYYGNGVSCTTGKGCTVDWSKVVSVIGNNAAANLATGGNAGWNKW